MSYNPYTFMPLSERIYKYSEDEAKNLMKCHDVPYEDGLSGTIDVKFKAISPFCVRDTNGENCNIEIDGEKKYFVPATSIKGMVRSILEIMSFADIKNTISDTRYSMREVRSNSDYQIKGNQKSGFLVKIRGKHYIIPAEMQKLDYEEVSEFVEEYQGITNVCFDDSGSSVYKYGLINNNYRFMCGNRCVMWLFSGAMAGKKHEYLFTTPTAISKDDLLPIDNKTFKDFLFIHEEENENVSWSFWRRELRDFNSVEDIINNSYKGIVPCFYREDNTKSDGKIKDLGFCLLYRQPYTKSIHDCLHPAHNGLNIDIPNAIFGFTSKANSLRGRVQFGNAFIHNCEIGEDVTYILSSPKASFFPFYLKQEKDAKRQNTYFSNRAIISGWKRYLRHNEIAAPVTVSEDSNVDTSFTYIKEGADYTSKIKFHNLRPFELGALLSAINFCNNSGKCFHSIGYAKPYGYGKTKVENLDLNIIGQESATIIDYINIFKEQLTAVGAITTNDWSEMLTQLILISSDAYSVRGDISYPSIDNGDFTTIKNDKGRIEDHTPTGKIEDYYERPAEVVETMEGIGVIQVYPGENKQLTIEGDRSGKRYVFEATAYELGKLSNNQRKKIGIGKRIKIKYEKRGGSISNIVFIGIP